MAKLHYANFDTYNKKRSLATKRTRYAFSIIAMSILIVCIINYAILSSKTIISPITYVWDYLRFLIFLTPIDRFLGVCMSRYSYGKNLFTGMYRRIGFDKQSKYFRVHYSPLLVFALIVSILGILSAISTFSSTVKIQVLATDKNDIYFTTVICGYLTTVLLFAASVCAIGYINKWRRIYRFEFEELDLSKEDKKELIAKEKEEYKEFKTEQKDKIKKYDAERKEINKQQRVARYTEQKEHFKEKQQEIKTNLQTVKNKLTNTTPISIAPQPHPLQVTKLDKLKELDALLKDGVITQAEYDIARRDILGQ